VRKVQLILHYGIISISPSNSAYHLSQYVRDDCELFCVLHTVDGDGWIDELFEFSLTKNSDHPVHHHQRLYSSRSG
jgi:hypothetical protein